MRVALVTPASLLRHDGDSLRPLAQARGLWAAGFRDFTLFSPQPDPSLPYAQERIAVRGPLRFVLDPIRGFDLIHAHQNAGLFLPGRLWVDLHGYAPLESALAWRRRPLSPGAAAFCALSHWATRRLARRGECLICAAESIAENVRRGAGFQPARRGRNDACATAPRIEVIRNCLDPAGFSPTACPELVVGVIGPFTGRWGAPAFELALKVARECPGVRFRIVGRINPAQREAAERVNNIQVLGEVDEAGFERFLNEVSVSLLAFEEWCRGGGARQKLLRSAAAGLAIVATPSALEGFQAPPETLIAHTPGELGALIRDRLADPAERKRRGQALRRTVERDHDVFIEGKKLAQLYDAQAKGLQTAGWT